MSRTLYLLRHGQALSAQGRGMQADHARELSAAGLREIETLSQRLQQHADFAPQVALVSSATRTQQTAQGLGVGNIQLREGYYNADPQELLAGLASLSDGISSALIVAHNPGISWLAASLLRPVSCDGFAPGAIMAMALVGGWGDIQPGQGRLLWRLDPPRYAANLPQQG